MAVHPPAIQHEPHYRAQPEADQIPGQVVIQDSPEPEQIVRDRQAGDRDDEAGKARENELDPLGNQLLQPPATTSSRRLSRNVQNRFPTQFTAMASDVDTTFASTGPPWTAPGVNRVKRSRLKIETSTTSPTPPTRQKLST